MRASGYWFSSSRATTGSPAVPGGRPEAPSIAGTGRDGGGETAGGDERARLVVTTMPPVGATAAGGVPVAVPMQAAETRPWARSTSMSSVPWARLVAGLLLLVLLGYAFFKWGLPFLSEKVMMMLLFSSDRSPIRAVLSGQVLVSVPPDWPRTLVFSLDQSEGIVRA